MSIATESGATSIEFANDETTAFEATQSDQQEKAQTWGDAFDSFMDVLSLGRDWDGMVADAPDKRILKVWLELIRQLRKAGWSPPTFIRPTPDGCVAVEWSPPHAMGRVEAELTPERVHWEITAI